MLGASGGGKLRWAHPGMTEKTNYFLGIAQYTSELLNVAFLENTSFAESQALGNDHKAEFGIVVKCLCYVYDSECM